MAHRPFASENVSIVDATDEHDDHGDRFVVYVVEIGFQGRRWRCRKRYSDFEKLYRKLVSVYGEKQVPYLTGKKKNPLGQFSSDFVMKRMRKLRVFVAEVVDTIETWHLAQQDKAIAGPGMEIGVNPFLYIFFEFERNLRDRTADTAGGGRGRADTSSGEAAAAATASFYIPEEATTPPTQGGALTAAAAEKAIVRKTPTLLAEELAQLLAKMDALQDDEDKMKLLDRLLGSRDGLTLDCLQAKAVLQRLFFSDAKLEAGRTMAPFVVDPENRQLVLDVIDFDEDEEELNREFDTWAE